MIISDDHDVSGGKKMQVNSSEDVSSGVPIVKAKGGKIQPH